MMNFHKQLFFGVISTLMEIKPAKKSLHAYCVICNSINMKNSNFHNCPIQDWPTERPAIQISSSGEQADSFWIRPVHVSPVPLTMERMFDQLPAELAGLMGNHNRIYRQFDLTLRTRFRQRWRLMSLLRSFGRL